MILLFYLISSNNFSLLFISKVNCHKDPDVRFELKQKLCFNSPITEHSNNPYDIFEIKPRKKLFEL